MTRIARSACAVEVIVETMMNPSIHSNTNPSQVTLPIIGWRRMTRGAGTMGVTRASPR